MLLKRKKFHADLAGELATSVLHVPTPPCPSEVVVFTTNASRP
jgi:hypothetical protein